MKIRLILTILATTILAQIGRAESNEYIYASNSYFAIEVVSVPDCQNFFLQFYLTNPTIFKHYTPYLYLKLKDGSILRFKNNYTNGQFWGKCDAAAANKLGKYDIEEMTIDDVGHEFSFNVCHGSAEIFKRHGYGSSSTSNGSSDGSSSGSSSTANAFPAPSNPWSSPDVKVIDSNFDNNGLRNRNLIKNFINSGKYNFYKMDFKVKLNKLPSATGVQYVAYLWNGKTRKYYAPSEIHTTSTSNTGTMYLMGEIKKKKDNHPGGFILSDVTASPDNPFAFVVVFVVKSGDTIEYFRTKLYNWNGTRLSYSPN